MDIDPEELSTEAAALDSEFSAAPTMEEIQAGQVVAEPETDPVEEYTEIFKAVLGPTFLIVAPNWQVQPAEVEALAGAYAAVLAKYFPQAGEIGPEVGAAVCTLAIFGPRLAMPRHPPKKPEEKPVDPNQPEPVSNGD